MNVSKLKNNLLLPSLVSKNGENDIASYSEKILRESIERKYFDKIYQ